MQSKPLPKRRSVFTCNQCRRDANRPHLRLPKKRCRRPFLPVSDVSSRPELEAC